MNEQWLPVVGFENRYEVSDMGSVRSVDTTDRFGRFHKGQLLKPHRRPGGYAQVVLGHTGSRLVHHLVLEAFVGPRPTGCETRHLDGKGANNHLDNLKWGTSKENKDDLRKHGRLATGERSGQVKLSDKDVARAFELRQQGKLHREIGAELGCSRAHITAILNGTWRKEATRRRESIQ